MSWMTALPFPPRRTAALSALVAVATGPLYAQTAAQTVPTTPTAAPPAPGQPASPPSHVNEQDLPVTLRAEEFTGRPDRVLNMVRDVEISARGMSVLR